LGEGVCQDHAHALISLARTIGLPARYVSGYLHADADGHAHEAAHAWAEVWVEGLGWIGFDAANRCCPDERYVRLGSGYDAQRRRAHSRRRHGRQPRGDECCCCGLERAAIKVSSQ
jgi:transglutaminase-like putative cysteine protease